jgi:hypothetical protein
MTVYLVISLPKIPYVNRIYMVLANPTHDLAMPNDKATQTASPVAQDRWARMRTTLCSACCIDALQLSSRKGDPGFALLFALLPLTLPVQQLEGLL